MNKYISATIALFMLSQVELYAHGAHGTGFLAGLTHPIFGLDHLVALLGIGLLGATLQTEKKWLPSMAFVIAMLFGGLFGIRSEALALTEFVIVGSVLVTGLLIAFSIQTQLIFILILAIGFGFFHGHAHGTEMPIDSNVPLYFLGFIIGAVLLSLLGWSIGKWIKEPVQLQLLGAFIAGMGLMMVLA